jgi:hypothetical protein
VATPFFCVLNLGNQYPALFSPLLPYYFTVPFFLQCLKYPRTSSALFWCRINFARFLASDPSTVSSIHYAFHLHYHCSTPPTSPPFPHPYISSTSRNHLFYGLFTPSLMNIFSWGDMVKYWRTNSFPLIPHPQRTIVKFSTRGREVASAHRSAEAPHAYIDLYPYVVEVPTCHRRTATPSLQTQMDSSIPHSLPFFTTPQFLVPRKLECSFFFHVINLLFFSFFHFNLFPPKKITRKITRTLAFLSFFFLPSYAFFPSSF